MRSGDIVPGGAHHCQPREPITTLQGLSFILTCWVKSVPLSADPEMAHVANDKSGKSSGWGPFERGSVPVSELADMLVLTYPLPAKPFRNQAVPPCETNKGAVEIKGGCWVALEQKPPCFSDQAEYQGKCYLPVAKPQRLPQSAEP
jgi:hypothetical protein